MKLHLPHLLRRSLIAALCTVSFSQTPALATTEIEVNENEFYTITSGISDANTTITLGANASLTVGCGVAVNASTTAAQVSMANGSTIILQNAQYWTGHVFNADISVDGAANISGATNGDSSTVTGTISGNGTLALVHAGSGTNVWTLSSAISDGTDSTLAVTVNSNVTMSDANTYTGGTTLKGCTLTTSNSAALANGALEVEGGTLKIDSSGGLQLSTLNGSAGTVNTNGNALTLGYGITDTTTTASYSGTLSGNGTLEKVGAGTQVLSGTTTLSSITVTEGNLELAGTTTLQNSISVAADAELVLSGALTLGSGITSSGTVTLKEGASFAFGASALTVENGFTLISGGSVSGYDGFDVNNITFTAGNVSSADLTGRYTIDTTNGGVTIKFTLADLEWNGGNESNTWSTSTDYTNWTSGDSSASFLSYDKVTFGSTGAGDVVVDEAGVTAASMTISGSGYSFSGGSITAEADMSVEAEATATFNQALTVGGSLTNAGSLTLNNTLTVAGSLTSTGTLTVGERVTLALSGATLSGNLVLNAGSTADITGATRSGTLTVSGSGTLAFTGNANSSAFTSISGLTDADKWTGTMQFTGTLTDTDLRSYGNKNSTIEFNGASGYLSTGTTTYTSNILLTGTNSDNTGTAVDFNNGGKGDCRTFSGTVSGKGDMLRSAAGSQQTFIFSGNVSGWTGNFKLTGDAGNDPWTSVKFTDNAMNINAGLANSTTNKTLNITFENTKANEVMMVNGNITSSGGTTTVAVTSGTVRFSGTGSSVGSMSVAADAAVNLTGSITVSETLTSTGAFTGTGNLTLGANATATVNDISLSGALANSGSLTLNGTTSFGSMTNGGSLTVNGTTTISNYVFTSNASSGTITLGANASLSLTNTSDAARNLSGLVTLGEGATLTIADTANNGTQSNRFSVNGGLTLSGNATICYNRSGNIDDGLLLNSTITGSNYTITKTGSGRLWLSNSDAGKYSNVSFIVEGGDLRIGGTNSKAIPAGITKVELKAGTTLSFVANASTGANAFATELKLAGGSTVDLRGTNSNTASYDFSGAMELGASEENPYVTLTPGNSGRTLNISGKITGDGGISLGGTGAMTLKLSNAENSFTGGIKVDSTRTTAVTVTLDKASAAGTGVINLGSNTSSSLNVTGNTTETEEGASPAYDKMSNTVTGSGKLNIAGGRVEMSGTGSNVGSMTVAETAAVNLTGSLEVTAEAELAGTLSVKDDATLSLGEALGITSNSSEGATMSGVSYGTLSSNDTLSESVATYFSGKDNIWHISGTGETHTLNGAVLELKGDGSVLLSNISFTGSSLVLGSHCLALENVSFDATSGISADGGTASLYGSGNIVLSADDFVNETMLLGDGDGGQVQSSTTTTLTVSRFNGLNVTEGAALTLDVNGILSTDKLNEGTTIYLAGVRADSGSVISVTGYNGAVVTRDDGNGIYISTGDAVPEPATATLSLLALAALAARRRRR